MWYKIAHDFVPSNVLLPKAYPKANGQCRLCTNANNLLHRVATCGGADGIWCWTRTRLPMLQRMDARHIPSQWLIFPNFSLWPQPNDNATIWILVHMACYKLQNHPSLSTTDDIHFLWQSKWINCRWSKWHQIYGNYSDICYRVIFPLASCYHIFTLAWGMRHLSNTLTRTVIQVACLNFVCKFSTLPYKTWQY
jgi:hypothetical protein